MKRYYYHTPDGELHGPVDVDFLIREIRYAGLPLGLMVREEHSEDWIWVGDVSGTPPEWQSFKEQDAGTEEWMKPGKVWRCGRKPHFNWLFSLLAMRGRSSRWEAVVAYGALLVFAPPVRRVFVEPAFGLNPFLSEYFLLFCWDCCCCFSFYFVSFRWG